MSLVEYLTPYLEREMKKDEQDKAITTWREELAALEKKGKKQLRTKKNVARYSSYFLTSATALTLAITTTVATAAFFPMIPMGGLIFIGTLSFILDLTMFNKSVYKSLHLLATLTRTVRDDTFAKALLHDPETLEYINNLLEADFETAKQQIEATNNRINDPKLKELRTKMALEKKKEELRQKKCSQLLLRARLFRTQTINRYINPAIKRKKAEQEWRELSFKRSKQNESQDFLWFCTKLEAVKKKTRLVWCGKLALLVLGSFFPAGIGLGFGAMAAVHIAEFLSLAFGVTSLSILLPFTIIGAAVLGFTYAFLMYKSLYKFINKISLDGTLDKLRNFSLKPKYWDDMDNKDKATLMVSWGIKIILGCFILPIGIVAILFSAGAFIDATFKITTAIMAAVTQADLAAKTVQTTALVINIVMSALVLPIKLIFGIEHSIGGLNKIGAVFKGAINSIRENKFRQIGEDIKKNPLKILLYGVGFIIAAVALVVHIVTEAITFSGEGATSEIAWTGNTYNNVTQAFMSAQTAANVIVSASSVQEGVEHGDLVIKDAKDKEGFSITRALYDLPAGIFNGIIQKFSGKAKEKVPERVSLLNDDSGTGDDNNNNASAVNSGNHPIVTTEKPETNDSQLKVPASPEEEEEIIADDSQLKVPANKDDDPQAKNKKRRRSNSKNEKPTAISAVVDKPTEENLPPITTPTIRG